MTLSLGEPGKARCEVAPFTLETINERLNDVLGHAEELARRATQSADTLSGPAPPFPDKETEGKLVDEGCRMASLTASINAIQITLGRLESELARIAEVVK